MHNVPLHERFPLNSDSTLFPQQDDVGANGLQMFCPDTATWHIPDTGSVGAWVEQACPAGLKVCGLQPNVLGYQGPGLDDVGLANLNFRCCGSGKIVLFLKGFGCVKSQ